MIYILILLNSFYSFSYTSETFTMNAPKTYKEEVKMFQSDVMFLKTDAPDDGSVFVKLIRNNSDVGDMKKLLLNKIRTSKSLNSSGPVVVNMKAIKEINYYSTILTSHSGKMMTFVSVAKKNKTDYLFIMQKSSAVHFSRDNKYLLESLESLRFIK